MKFTRLDIALLYWISGVVGYLVSTTLFRNEYFSGMFHVLWIIATFLILVSIVIRHRNKRKRRDVDEKSSKEDL